MQDANKSSEQNPWKTIKVESRYENPWIELEHHQVITPSGSEGIYGKVKMKNLAIGIIPLDEESNTWLVGQYRYTIDEYSWEIPMGGGPLGIDPLQSAKRELKEETGIQAKDWKYLMKIHTSNCITDEIGLVYVARRLSHGSTEFDETEDLKILKVPFTTAIDMIAEGKITDSISVGGLLMLDRKLRNSKD